MVLFVFIKPVIYLWTNDEDKVVSKFIYKHKGSINLDLLEIIRNIYLKCMTFKGFNIVCCINGHIIKQLSQPLFRFVVYIYVDTENHIFHAVPFLS